MPYLSCLLVDVGDNPDRPRPGRRWLEQPYRVHQRLAMAFPSDPGRSLRDYQRPYDPAEFPSQQAADAVMDGKADVGEERSDANGFLYRVDHGVRGGGPPVILVQSARRPNWDYAFGLTPGARSPATGGPVGNAGCLLAAQPDVKFLRFVPRPGEGTPDPALPAAADIRAFDVPISAGAVFRFRLGANPTRRLAQGPFAGKRVGVGGGAPAILAWLARKGEEGGFDPIFEPDAAGWDPAWRIETGTLYASKGGEGGNVVRRISIFFANIDGRLRVVDPARFCKAVTLGIGPAKAFGFGLLSLARATP
jgi:hypothetical protein